MAGHGHGGGGQAKAPSAGPKGGLEARFAVDATVTLTGIIAGAAACVLGRVMGRRR